MAYMIYKSSDPNTPFAIINEETQDTTSASIVFVGKRRVDYGNSQQQNQLWQLENFAAPTAPPRPITGQLWYDTAVNYMKVFNGTAFVRISNAAAAATPPSNPTVGQFWFETNGQVLYIWNSTQWLAIGPNNDSLIFALIFG